jgi:DNA-directed RNA polymerase specialized sigma24 family protein/ribosome-associated translation inhibitor RaiA
MNVHFSYKDGKTPELEKEINHLIEKLRKRLQVFRPELVHLKGGIEQSSPREGTTVSLNLRLPSGQMAVQKSAATAAAAVKAACEDLLQQVGKHKAQLRNRRKWPRHRDADFRGARHVPFEKTVAAVPLPTASADDIRSYVNANLARLERFVERELYFRETADEISPDSIAREEVIDEAIANALGDGADKPERLALEPWLYRLAMRAIDELSASGAENSPAVHLEDSARKPNVRGTDDSELQFHQPDETLIRENVIADRRTPTPEDIASSDELIALMQVALNDASRADRESFILHAVEGFSVEEIVAITDRKSEEVQASIASAREHLRRNAPISHRPAYKRIQATTGT